jgi:hypothetical protein
MSELDIEYPCEWPYKVIGANEEFFEHSIHQALTDVEYRISESNRSSGGRYISFDVVARVRDERHRYWLYNRLRSLEFVKVVL